MASGTWITQNKVRAGAYINFVGKNDDAWDVNGRNVMTMPVVMDWGPDNEIFELKSSQLVDGSSEKLIGYNASDPESLVYRQALTDCTTALLYKLNSRGGAYAKHIQKNSFDEIWYIMEAKYKGVCGNKITYKVIENTSDNTNVDFITYYRGTEKDKQTVSRLKSIRKMLMSGELKQNDWINIKPQIAQPYLWFDGNQYRIAMEANPKTYVGEDGNNLRARILIGKEKATLIIYDDKLELQRGDIPLNTPFTVKDFPENDYVIFTEATRGIITSADISQSGDFVEVIEPRMLLEAGATLTGGMNGVCSTSEQANAKWGGLTAVAKAEGEEGNRYEFAVQDDVTEEGEAVNYDLPFRVVCTKMFYAQKGTQPQYGQAKLSIWKRDPADKAEYSFHFEAEVHPLLPKEYYKVLPEGSLSGKDESYMEGHVSSGVLKDEYSHLADGAYAKMSNNPCISGKIKDPETGKVIEEKYYDYFGNIVVVTAYSEKDPVPELDVRGIVTEVPSDTPYKHYWCQLIIRNKDKCVWANQRELIPDNWQVEQHYIKNESNESNEIDWTVQNFRVNEEEFPDRNVLEFELVAPSWGTKDNLDVTLKSIISDGMIVSPGDFKPIMLKSPIEFTVLQVRSKLKPEEQLFFNTDVELVLKDESRRDFNISVILENAGSRFVFDKKALDMNSWSLYGDLTENDWDVAGVMKISDVRILIVAYYRGKLPYQAGDIVLVRNEDQDIVKDKNTGGTVKIAEDLPVLKIVEEQPEVDLYLQSDIELIDCETTESQFNVPILLGNAGTRYTFNDKALKTSSWGVIGSLSEEKWGVLGIEKVSGTQLILKLMYKGELPYSDGDIVKVYNIIEGMVLDTQTGNNVNIKDVAPVLKMVKQSPEPTRKLYFDTQLQTIDATTTETEFGTTVLLGNAETLYKFNDKALLETSWKASGSVAGDNWQVIGVSRISDTKLSFGVSYKGTLPYTDGEVITLTNTVKGIAQNKETGKDVDVSDTVQIFKLMKEPPEPTKDLNFVYDTELVEVSRQDRNFKGGIVLGNAGTRYKFNDKALQTSSWEAFGTTSEKQWQVNGVERVSDTQIIVSFEYTGELPYSEGDLISVADVVKDIVTDKTTGTDVEINDFAILLKMVEAEPELDIFFNSDIQLVESGTTETEFGTSIILDNAGTKYGFNEKALDVKSWQALGTVSSWENWSILGINKLSDTRLTFILKYKGTLPYSVNDVVCIKNEINTIITDKEQAKEVKFDDQAPVIKVVENAPEPTEPLDFNSDIELVEVSGEVVDFKTSIFLVNAGTKYAFNDKALSLLSWEATGTRSGNNWEILKVEKLSDVQLVYSLHYKGTLPYKANDVVSITNIERPIVTDKTTGAEVEVKHRVAVIKTVKEDPETDLYFNSDIELVDFDTQVTEFNTVVILGNAGTKYAFNDRALEAVNWKASGSLSGDNWGVSNIEKLSDTRIMLSLQFKGELPYVKDDLISVRNLVETMVTDKETGDDVIINDKAPVLKMVDASPEPTETLSFNSDIQLVDIETEETEYKATVILENAGSRYIFNDKALETTSWQGNGLLSANNWDVLNVLRTANTRVEITLKYKGTLPYAENDIVSISNIVKDIIRDTRQGTEVEIEDSVPVLKMVVQEPELEFNSDIELVDCDRLEKQFTTSIILGNANDRYMFNDRALDPENWFVKGTLSAGDWEILKIAKSRDDQLTFVFQFKGDLPYIKDDIVVITNFYERIVYDKVLKRDASISDSAPVLKVVKQDPPKPEDKKLKIVINDRIINGTTVAQIKGLNPKMLIQEMVNRELLENDYIVFGGEGYLQKTFEVIRLKGGSSKVDTYTSSDGYFALIKGERWNCMALPQEKVANTIKDAAIALIKDLRDEQGIKCQLVLDNYAGTNCNYEGVISVKQGYKSAQEIIPRYIFCARVAGMTAGARFNESNTFKVINGATEIIYYDEEKPYTNDEYINKLKEGHFLISKRRDLTIVCEKDQNTLHEPYPRQTVNYSFTKNRVIRTLDEINNTIVDIWESRFVGKVSNNDKGRTLYKTSLINYMRELERLEAIQNFNPQNDVSVEQGEKLDSVVVNLAVQPVDAMEKLYMTINIQ